MHNPSRSSTQRACPGAYCLPSEAQILFKVPCCHNFHFEHSLKGCNLMWQTNLSCGYRSTKLLFTHEQAEKQRVSFVLIHTLLPSAHRNVPPLSWCMLYPSQSFPEKNWNLKSLLSFLFFLWWGLWEFCFNQEASFYVMLFLISRVHSIFFIIVIHWLCFGNSFSKFLHCILIFHTAFYCREFYSHWSPLYSYFTGYCFGVLSFYLSHH